MIRKSLAQVFSCKFCKIIKNTFLKEHLQVTASVVDLLKFLLAYLHSILWLLLTESQTAIVDLQAMWYPTVRRTLVCLSKLYNCIGVSTVKMAEVQHKIFCCVKGYHCCHWFSKCRLRRTVLLGIRPCVLSRNSSFVEVVNAIVYKINWRLTRFLLFQSLQWKHQNNIWNLTSL